MRYLQNVNEMRTKYFTINKYRQDVSINEAKKLLFPKIRGTFIPSWDWQVSGGVALNWLGVRIRLIPIRKRDNIFFNDKRKEK